MPMTPSQPDRDSDALEPIDQAVADRLARLRTMPIELTALRRAVDAEIGTSTSRQRRSMFLRMMTPMRAVAASLLVGGLLVALIIASSGGPVLASADTMAEIHEDVVSGNTHSNHKRKSVNSIEAANKALSSENPAAPSLPAIGQDQVMSCCVHSVGHKMISCLSIVVDGMPVSIAVANAADVKMPASQTITVDGATYHLQSARGVNMAMTQRAGRWVCVMGGLPTARLIELGKQLQF